MSLPFFTSFARNSQSLSSRRVQPKGQSLGTHVPNRRSVDAASSRKRGAAHLLSGLDDDIEPCLESCGEYSDHDEKPCTASRLKVGVLGLGNVGRSVATCLAARPGLIELAVYNRRSQPIEPFRLIPGVRVKSSAADICSWADVIIVCMSTYEVAASILGSPEALRALKGSAIIQLTHGTPQQALDAADAVRRAKGTYLDACLLGSPDDLGSAGTCIIASGERAAWDRSERVLKLLAPKSFWCGEQPTLANAANIALFTFLASCYMGYVHALQLGQRFGLPEKVLPTLISGGMIPLLQEVIQSGSISVTPKQSTTQPEPCQAVSSAQKMGSEEWYRELEQCRQVSAEAGVSTVALDGLLAWARERGLGSATMPAYATASAGTHRESSSGYVPLLQNPCIEMSSADVTGSAPLGMEVEKKVGSPVAIETSGEDGDHFSDEAIAGILRDVSGNFEFEESKLDLNGVFELFPELAQEFDHELALA